MIFVQFQQKINSPLHILHKNPVVLSTFYYLLNAIFHAFLKQILNLNLLQFTLLTENFTVKQCSDVAKFKACFKCKCTFNFFAVVWSVNVEANVLAADPLSPYMAVVDNDQKCKYMYTYK